MAAVRINIRRIHKVETFQTVVRLNYIYRIPTFDGDMLKSPANFFCKLIFSINDFLGILPAKSYPNVPSSILAKDILERVHTAHALCAGEKN